MESKGRLPMDTYRLVLSLDFFLETLLFYMHANMQEGNKRDEHFLMALIAFMTSCAIVYSVR